VSLDAVDYDDKGNMVFSGRSKANAFVRIYVDNKPVGEAAVGSDNRWVFSGGPQIAPGEHTFRVDEIDAGGKVTSRIELPFFREAPAKVAELAQAEAPPPQPAETGAAAQAANTPPQPAPEQPVAAPEQAAGTPGAPPQPAPEQPVAAPEQAAGTPAAPQEPATAVSPQPAPQQPVAAPEQTAGTPAAPQEPATAVSPQPAPEQPVAAQPEGQEQQAAAPQPEPKAEPVPRPKSGRIIIQPGNNLWKLSRVIYGKGTQYTVIYEANRDLIRDADLIYPGQIFRTPNVVPPEKISPRRKTPLVPGETAQ
jgi:nucleoid-associated protein YgaU